MADPTAAAVQPNTPPRQREAGSSSPPSRDVNMSPPISTIRENGRSPASTIGVSSANSQPTRQSPHHQATRTPESGVDTPVRPYRRNGDHQGQSPPLVGGASLPPFSPASEAPFTINAVGIPTSENARETKNRDEKTYDDGYDSDGQLGPFLDAIANEPDITEDDEDGDLPPSMVDGSPVAEQTTTTAGSEGVAIPPWFMTPAQINGLQFLSMHSYHTGGLWS